MRVSIDPADEVEIPTCVDCGEVSEFAVCEECQDERDYIDHLSDEELETGVWYEA